MALAVGCGGTQSANELSDGGDGGADIGVDTERDATAPRDGRADGRPDAEGKDGATDSRAKDGAEDTTSTDSPGDSTGSMDGGADGTPDAPSDVTTTADSESVDSAKIDAPADAPSDTGTMDVGTADAAPKDSGTEAGGIDSATDTGADSPVESATADAPAESGSDAGCTGVAAGSGGTLNWAENFGTTGFTEPSAVAIDPSTGDVVIVGGFDGSINFGGGVLDSDADAASGSDTFVARLDSSGTYKWAKDFGNGAAVSAHDVAVDTSGNTFVGGTFESSVDFGCGTLTAVGDFDVFLVRFDSSGTCTWSNSYGASGEAQNLDSTVLDGSGNVVIGGIARGVSFGGGALTGYFMAKFTSAGAYSWSKAITATSTTSSPTLALDSSDNVILAGSFDGSADFGGGTLSSGSGGVAAFVAKYDSSGTYVWAKSYPAGIDAGTDVGSDVSTGGLAVDACGDIFVTGDFFGTIDFGSATMLTGSNPDDAYVFLAKLDPSGAALWANEYVGGLAAGFSGGTLAVSALGGPIMTTAFGGTIDFGGGGLTSAGGGSVVVASYDANGNYRWGYAGGPPSTAEGSGPASIRGIAASQTAVFLLGGFGALPCSCATSAPGTTLVLDGKTLMAASAEDAFVASFAP
jgi:hypothetical protein